jgi:hypothetical protein
LSVRSVTVGADRLPVCGAPPSPWASAAFAPPFDPPPGVALLENRAVPTRRAPAGELGDADAPEAFGVWGRFPLADGLAGAGAP